MFGEGTKKYKRVEGRKSFWESNRKDGKVQIKIGDWKQTFSIDCQQKY